MSSDATPPVASPSARVTDGPDAGHSGGAGCWNRIGIRGDRSCVQLPVQVHCRNCPVYSAAAAALLDAPNPNADLACQFTEQTTADSESPPPAGESVMIFRLGVEWFALPTRLCVEVVEVRPIHSLPRRRQGGVVLGVVAVRGQLVVCLSIAGLLNATADAAPAQPAATAAGSVRERLLLVGWSEGTVAFPVAEVAGVQRLQTRQRVNVPATVSQSQSRLTTSLLLAESRSIALLDEQQLYRSIQQSLA